MNYISNLAWGHFPKIPPGAGCNDVWATLLNLWPPESGQALGMHRMFGHRNEMAENSKQMKKPSWASDPYLFGIRPKLFIASLISSLT